jgi:hypothetical protein
MNSQTIQTDSKALDELDKWREDRIKEATPAKSKAPEYKLREINRIYEILKQSIVSGPKEALEEFHRQFRPVKSFKVMD